MSKAAPAPDESYSALTGRRRPLSSTSRLLELRPRIARLAVPDPAGEFDASSPWSKTSIVAIDLMSSLTLDAPVRSMSRRVITSTGAGPSALTRLIAEPVISMRCPASCA